MKISWSSNFETGIDVIDEQHKRILYYINDIDEVCFTHDREKIKDILDNIIDYTQSHFTFEESLQQEAGYQFSVPHKKVHDLFIKKIEDYRLRFLKGETIEEDLYQVLTKWLINHIKHDDADYVGAVKDNMNQLIQEKQKKKGWLARFFA
ncbi:bacteriohemerythrin [Acinetobacter boissieri]|uniref:Hemerythrin n=1 Tax=Acinetobacter boissieri TaxID=1219383 RepID=A0A1G6HDH3_9GAMM|nr:bacteriohemerythrin [Acinetobacter boissieri]SDB92203.1 hemerythrin [Acinetobacter boissieri]